MSVLEEYLTNIAEAIREVEGAEGPIPAAEFAERVRGIKALPPPGKDLEDYSWDEITAISKAGKAREYFKLGDVKTAILFAEGKELNNLGHMLIPQFQIIGFDHDDVSEPNTYGRPKAGITFRFGVVPVPSSFSELWSFNVLGGPLNNDNAAIENAYSWETCDMRTLTLPDLKSKLSVGLQNAICKVKKKTVSGTDLSIVTTDDDLWLLSEVEIVGAADMSYPGEGEQYEFYKQYPSSASLINLDQYGAPGPFSLRSLGNLEGYKSLHVIYTPDSRIRFDLSDTNTPYQLVFCFCV